MGVYTANVETKVNFGELTNLENRISKLKNNTIKIPVQLDTSSIKPSDLTKGMEKTVSQMQKSYSTAISNAWKSQFQSIGSKSSEQSALSSYYSKQAKEYEKIASLSSKYNTKQSDLSVAKLNSKYDSYNGIGVSTASLDADIAKIKKLSSTMESLQKDFNSGKMKPEDVSKYITGDEELSATIARVKNGLGILETEMGKPLTIGEQSALSSKISNWANENSKAVKKYAGEISKLQDAANGATTTMDKKNVLSQFQELNSKASADGLLGKSFLADTKEKLSKFTSWFSVSQIVMEGVQQLKNMANAVVEVDTAMTSLYKVTNETSTAYSNFQKGSSDVAKSLGRDTASYIDQTATWAKLGYNLSQSSELAKVSSIYANVGEVDDQTAVSDIVTVLKAFDIDTSQAETVVDKLNKLGNEFATSSADLGSGLSRSASALALGGMDINKSLALITGGAEITQSADEMGNALKIGQMRVMGKQFMPLYYENNNLCLAV